MSAWDVLTVSTFMFSVWPILFICKWNNSIVYHIFVFYVRLFQFIFQLQHELTTPTDHLEQPDRLVVVGEQPPDNGDMCLFIDYVVVFQPDKISTIKRTLSLRNLKVGRGNVRTCLFFSGEFWITQPHLRFVV